MPENLASFIPSTVDAEGASVPVATGILAPINDLFVSAAGDGVAFQTSHPVASDRGVFSIRDGLSLTVDLRSVRPSHVQCLIAVLARQPTPHCRTALQSTVIDPECSLVLWSDLPDIALLASDAWTRIRAAGKIDRATAATTPWLYGNKLRLTRFVAPVAAITLPADVPVLDLMSGTGIIARSLAHRHPVAVNDANPYAALLSRSQWISGSVVDSNAIAERLREPFADNQQRLNILAERALINEADLLHGDIDDETLARFQQTLAPALPITDGKQDRTSRLVTERYAGVYFGVAQSIEIDSLRHAIERAFPESGAERDVCLTALISACITCASGPHFAQPTAPKSVKALRNLLERQARSVAWEFELAMGRLVIREHLRHPLLSATCDGWRGALAAFKLANLGRDAAVYVDPPYSKLQYSRYYHVLNVLLTYDYPPVAGRGRYPPRQNRFSSRFEYQPGMARREMREMIQACANADLTTLVSYGDAGFVSIDGLLADMAAAFSSVEMFTEVLRHHSQGRRLATSRAVAIEHLVVGRVR